MPEKAPAKAELKIDDKVMDLPVIVGTEDEHGDRHRQAARARPGYVTLDPAYMNTASTTSAITFLDGEKGILRYRGIPIEQLAEKSTFVETAYLLIYGQLPTKTELDAFSHAAHASLADPRGHEALLRRLSRRPPTRWRSCRRWCCSLSSFYPEALDVKNKDEHRHRPSRACSSKVRTIAAFSYKKSIGQPFVYPKNYLSLLRELPAHDVRGPGRAVRGRRRRS